MKIKFCLPALFIFSIMQAQDTIYYNADWEKTTKPNHEFYRPLPLQKFGELLLLKDYYKNGNLQFQGYIYPHDEHNYVGDAYWYEENGFDSSKSQNINESSEKELIYYNEDGSIWQKVLYNQNGKKSKISVYLKGKELFSGSISDYEKYKGDFSTKIPDSYYYRPFEETKEMESIETVVVIAPPSPIENQKSTKPKEHYFEVIYWQNGKKAKESKFELNEYESGKLVEEKFWDKTGKLISETNSENFSEEKKYLKVDYFTRNNFAVEVKSQWEMKNESREGKSSFYDSNGKLIREEIYKQGLILEDADLSDSSVLNKRIYKNNEPFEGSFTEKAGPFEFSYVLQKGKKIGTETVKNTETSKIVAEGVYKDSKPFDGKFISTERYIVSNYENGVLDGVQIIYQNFYDDIPAEEYEVKNGKRDGFRKIYEYGELKFESVYKNDSIYSGKVFDGEEELTYLNGNLTERLVLNHYGEGFRSIEKFENNQISSVEYFNFSIKEKPQKSYQGKYKNGKPFQGYFSNQVIVDDIHLIDYFENGKIKNQYSFDIVEQMENYNHYIYNQKAEFKDGEVINGPEYLPPTDHGFIKQNYLNGIINALEVNIFSMHYFNRINFERKNDEILVTEFQSPYQVKIFPKDNIITASLYENNQLIKTQKPVNEVKEGSPNSSTFYYFKENQIKTYTIQRDTFDEYEEIDRNQFTVKILSIFPIEEKKNLDDVMTQFSNAFQSKDFDHIFDVGDSSLFPFTEKQYLSFLEYDENGKPEFGIRIKQEKNGEILLEGIEDNKVKKTAKVKSTLELTANDNKIINDLMHQLLNDF